MERTLASSVHPGFLDFRLGFFGNFLDLHLIFLSELCLVSLQLWALKCGVLDDSMLVKLHLAPVVLLFHAIELSLEGLYLLLLLQHPSVESFLHVPGVLG